MKKALSIVLTLLLALTTYAFSTGEYATYKCLIQLTNYGGEGAYVVVSLINPHGEYERTLSMSGDDEEWYEDMPAWYEFYNGKKENIDGVTGASIISGGRKITVLGIDPAKIDAGYKLRFETAVEDKEYYEKDLEIDLTTEVANQRLKGEGYIRYVQLIKK